MSLAQVGILTSVPIVIGVFTGILWSAFSDAIARRKPFLIQSTLLTALFTLSTAFFSAFEELLILGVLRSILIPPAEGLIVANLLGMSDYRTRATTYSGFAVWGSLGWAAATGLAGVVVQAFGIKAALYLATLLFAAALVTAFFIPELQTRREGTLAKPLHVPISHFSMLKALLINRKLAVFLLFSLPLALAINASARFFPIYLDTLGALPLLIGLVFTVPALLEVPVFPRVGKLCDQWGRKKPLLIFSATVYGSLFLLLAFTAHPLVLFAIYSVLAPLAWPSLITGASTLVSEIVPEEQWVTAQNVFTIWMWSIGGILGPLIGGFISNLLGLRPMFGIVATLAFVSALLFTKIEES